MLVDVTLPPGTSCVGDVCVPPASGSELAASATNCVFDPATGVLDIGDLPVGGTVTLTITLAVTTTESGEAVAEVTRATEPDVDS